MYPVGAIRKVEKARRTLIEVLDIKYTATGVRNPQLQSNCVCVRGNVILSGQPGKYRVTRGKAQAESLVESRAVTDEKVGLETKRW